MVLEKPIGRRLRIPKAINAIRSLEASDSDALQLLIMTQFFPPDFAATGQLIDELVTQLGNQGTNVSVFTGQPGYAFQKGEAPQVEKRGRVLVKRSRMTQLFPSRIRGKALSGLLFAIRCIFHIAKQAKQYQVLLVTTAPPFLPVIGYFANLFLKLPYVCLLYDLYPDIAIELNVVTAKHPIARLWQLINRQVWKRSAGIIVLSDSMKSRIIAHCPDVADKISVIHSWSNDKKIIPISKSDNWFAKEHHLDEQFVVLYSGNMGRCHDIDTLFQAALKLKDHPILFVCIGGGAKRSKLKEQINAHGLTNFRFLPYQEKSVLPYSLTASDVSLVSVAPKMESLVAPSKLYPAMAAGRPIAAICPPTSYLRSLLKTSQGGETFDNGNAQALADYILHLFNHPDKAKQIGESGRQYMQAHFTPNIISKQYLEVLKAAPNN
ncbi:MAG: glycosyltransferase family 4 protein [Cyanobacteria bacterium J06573_11]